MNDKEFYEKLDALIEQLMAGVPHISLDIALLNECLMELHSRQEKVK